MNVGEPLPLFLILIEANADRYRHHGYDGEDDDDEDDDDYAIGQNFANVPVSSDWINSLNRLRSSNWCDRCRPS